MKCKLRFYLRNVKAKLALSEQKYLYCSTQLPLKRQNRDSLSGKKIILSLVQAVRQLEPLRGNMSRLTLPILVLFSLSRNDSSTPPLKMKLTIKGLLILLAGTIIASLNQIWFTHQQAQPWGWRPSDLLFMLISMVTIVHSASHMFSVVGAIYCGSNYKWRR